MVGELFPDGKDAWAISKNVDNGFRIYMEKRARIITNDMLFEELAFGGEAIMAS